MKILDRLKKIDVELQKKIEFYNKSISRLKPYEGRPIEVHEFEEVNKILADIQRTFEEVYPLYQYIIDRHQFAQESVEKYVKFRDNIIKNGAQEEAKPE